MAVSCGTFTVTKPKATGGVAAMQVQSILFYEVCDAYLQSIGFVDDPQAKMTTTEVLLIALVAAWFFGNNLRVARQAAWESGLVVYPLSESRFNRRWHKVQESDWQAILNLLAKQQPADTYVIDSCPMPVCHNQRASRCHLYQDANNAYWGFCAAKDVYYYGLKAHVIVTATGRPVEVLLLCGCSADLTGMKEMSLDLPTGSRLYGDKAYTDYRYEEQLLASRQITLLPIRKSNAKRQHKKEVAQALSRGRKRIETTFSQVTAKLPHRLRAVTPAGFESKIMALFVAFAICCAEKEKQQTKDG
jgi:hypothetical protein